MREDSGVDLDEPTLDRRVRDLVDDPIGGPVAAAVAALAAALVASTARAAHGSWAEAKGAAAQGDQLRLRLARLAEADASAYREAVVALESPQGDAELAHALELAADVPLEIAQAATDVVQLGADVAERGDPRLAADAAAAALLAEAATRAAAHLVSVNLTTGGGDGRLARAANLVNAAADGSRRARAATSY
jgi:formiminotetrahydrofolate cyclodeaminase